MPDAPTPEEVAREIAGKFYVLANEAEITLEGCIARALRDERERAAKVAQQWYHDTHHCNAMPATCACSEEPDFVSGEVAAAAIREGGQ